MQVRPGVGGVEGHASFRWRGQKIGGRRLYYDTGNVCDGEIALTVET